jgi:hypothetical protein
MRVGKFRYSRRPDHQPDFPTRDHVIPRSVMPAMGTIVVCRRCNLDKGNRTLDQWHALLTEVGDARAKVVAEFMRRNAHLRLPERPTCTTVEVTSP